MQVNISNELDINAVSLFAQNCPVEGRQAETGAGEPHGGGPLRPGHRRSGNKQDEVLQALTK